MEVKGKQLHPAAKIIGSNEVICSSVEKSHLTLRPLREKRGKPSAQVANTGPACPLMRNFKPELHNLREEVHFTKLTNAITQGITSLQNELK